MTSAYLGQVQEEMLGRLDDRGAAADLTLGLLQLHGVDEFATAITLVPSCIIVAAQWTCPFHEPIGQEPAQETNVSELLSIHSTASAYLQVVILIRVCFLLMSFLESYFACCI